jgi:hypothetical protein
MSQAPFDYDPPANDTHGGLTLAIYADRPHVLAQIREIALNANLLVMSAQPMAGAASSAPSALSSATCWKPFSRKKRVPMLW